MKRKIIIEQNQDTILVGEAAKEFSVEGKVIAYKTNTYIAILTKIDETCFGFVVVESRNEPVFVCSSPIESIKLACDSSSRKVFIFDSLKEMIEKL